MPDLTLRGVLISIFALIMPVTLASQAASPAMTLQPYTVKTFDGKQADGELGHLAVPEKPGSSKTIQIGFVRLKSRRPGPGSPIVFLMGGAGRGIVMAQVPPFYRLFDRLRDLGDVILLDQRGIGESVPNLETLCGEDKNPLPDDLFINPHSLLAVQLTAIRSCANQVRKQGIDLANFSVAARADDLEYLRQALGADHLALLAWSAGTEVALEMIRRYGSHISTMVLAGTVGPNDVLQLPSTVDLHLRKLSALVADDPGYKGLPDLYATLEQIERTLDASPLKLTVNDSDNHPVQIQVGKLPLQAAISGELNDGRTFDSIPQWVYSLSRGESQPFQMKVEGMYRSLHSASLLGLVLGCERGWPKERLERVRRESAHALLGTDGSPLPEACEMLGITPTEKPPVFSNARVLFVSGTLDSAAPPFQAEEVRFGFPNSTHLVVTNATHDAIVSSDVQKAIANFMGGADVSTQSISLPTPSFAANGK